MKPVVVVTRRVEGRSPSGTGPVGTVRDGPRAAPPPTTEIGGRVLVIEDSPTIQAVARVVLKRAGFEVEIAGDWLAANALFHAAGRKPPDVVLVDVNLGTAMRGNMIVDAYREWRRKASRTRPALFLFSDMPAAELAKLTTECGADGFISKDSGLTSVVSVIRGWLAEHP